jgi:hypothetical protein
MNCVYVGENHSKPVEANSLSTVLHDQEQVVILGVEMVDSVRKLPGPAAHKTMDRDQ